MDLTPAERIILANQYEILSLINPKRAGEYKDLHKVVTEGFDEAIDDKFAMFSLKVGMSVSKEVTDILGMFSTLNKCYDALEDKDGVDARWLRFKGFDSSGESSHLRYCEYLIINQNRFSDLNITEILDLDSHSPEIDMYKRMLAQYNNSADKFNLTKDDIVRITNAAIHPSMRGKV